VRRLVAAFVLTPGP